MNLDRLKYHWYRFKYRQGRHLPLRVPVDVSLELASACNQWCTYCYHSDAKHLPFTKGIMPSTVAFKIIEQSAELGINALKFNWKGESTLHPEFKTITHYAKTFAGGSVFIDRLTNSNFKFPTNKDDIFDGLCNQTKVKISFDSFDRDIHNTQRAGGDWDLTFANINKFYNYPGRIKSKTKMVVQAVRTKLNENEDLVYLIKKHWPESGASVRDMVGGRVQKDLSALEARRRDPSARQSCLQAHVRLIFNKDGKAFPCCPDIGEKLELGDIRNESVKEIFNSAYARNLRMELKSGLAFHGDPCLNCSSYETFKGFNPNWDS